ncbi:cysteine peptidase family C39 domain-containing protein [Thalassobellus suaedae]|uniref:cysteine peptidase family C39 domain-containing protein n=1 Tax=Thalassobellus suaedae TaxID=3074124 RepID=UPI0039F4D9C1
MKNAFPFYKQPDSKDCGPTCLRIIAKHYGKLISLQDIRDLSETTRVGSNLLKLSDASESIGFKSLGAKLDFKVLVWVLKPYWENIKLLVLNIMMLFVQKT